MAKKDDEPVDPVNDEEEVFKSFGIEDDNAKRRVRELSAARVLAHRRLNPKPAKKKDDSPWGE